MTARQCWGAMVILFGFCFSFLAVPPAFADSWLEPEVKTTLSQNGQYRVIITPGGANEKTDTEQESSYPQNAYPQNASAQLDHKQANGKWATMWNKPIDNAVAPVKAILSDDGAYLVTFDNWYGAGLGDNVMVIYGADGALIKKMGLEELLPPYYAFGLPQSTSSRYWAYEQRFQPNDKIVEFNLIIPAKMEENMRDPGTVRMTYDIPNLRLVPVSDAEWTRAKNEGVTVAKELVAQFRAEISSVREGLKAPQDMGNYQWEYYVRSMMEQRYPSLDPESFSERPLIYDESYEEIEAETKKLVLDLFTSAGRSAHKNYIMASTQKDGLVRLLEANQPLIQSASLAGVSLYIFADDDHWPKLEALLKPSNANIVHVPLVTLERDPDELKHANKLERYIEEVEQSLPQN